MRSHSKRVAVPAQQFFARDTALASRFSHALFSRHPLRVALEGDTGCAKTDVLVRLARLGFPIAQLPFVPFLSAFASNPLPLLPDAALAWQAALHRAVEAAVDSDAARRSGLVFVARSPLAAWLELSRRGLPAVPPPALHPDDVVVRLEADATVVQQRIAMKTYHGGPEASLRNAIACDRPYGPFSFDCSLNTTSAKVSLLCVAAAAAAVLFFSNAFSPASDSRVAGAHWCATSVLSASSFPSAT